MAIGIFIPNCPKRIIDKYKDNNPCYERSLKLYEQGDRQGGSRQWAVETIKRWEENYTIKQAQAEKDMSLRKALEQAFKNGEVLVELQDSYHSTGRFLVTHIPPKKQYFRAQYCQASYKIKYKMVSALIEKSTGNVLWGEPRPKLKSA